jgi:hypothetical protein
MFCTTVLSTIMMLLYSCSTIPSSDRIIVNVNHLVHPMVSFNTPGSTVIVMQNADVDVYVFVDVSSTTRLQLHTQHVK